ncbi:hypothetical protein BCR34DRAFT_360389 [Clohesyomyces aquaticus]|uniref:Uncharacterized protein n=1 Tax=Clohesyomyces aquaticus TaxID=1231657 RepID=A0A1Y2A6Q8_9PLEO|nr:hypothetical protein BCR34DRAFT_360389 [Clohesyomyces aquaticus]
MTTGMQSPRTINTINICTRSGSQVPTRGIRSLISILIARSRWGGVVVSSFPLPPSYPKACSWLPTFGRYRRLSLTEPQTHKTGATMRVIDSFHYQVSVLCSIGRLSWVLHFIYHNGIVRYDVKCIGPCLYVCYDSYSSISFGIGASMLIGRLCCHRFHVSMPPSIPPPPCE